MDMDKMQAGHIPEQKNYKIFPQPESMLPASGMFAPADGASAQIDKLIAESDHSFVDILEEVYEDKN